MDGKHRNDQSTSNQGGFVSIHGLPCECVSDLSVWRNAVVDMTAHDKMACDPKQLLESLSKHAGEIVGTVQVFKRKP